MSAATRRSGRIGSSVSRTPVALLMALATAGEVGRSADYLVIEAGGEDARVPMGTMIDMIPSYEALVAAWTSPYVELRFRGL